MADPYLAISVDAYSTFEVLPYRLNTTTGEQVYSLGDYSSDASATIYLTAKQMGHLAREILVAEAAVKALERVALRSK